MALLDVQEAKYEQLEAQRLHRAHTKRVVLASGGGLVIIALAVFFAYATKQNIITFSLFHHGAKLTVQEQQQQQLAVQLQQDPSTVVPKTLAEIAATLKPDEFAVLAVPAERSVKPADSVSYDVYVARGSSATDKVTFSAIGLPNGIDATFSPTSVSGNSSSTLTLSVKNDVALGRYTFALHGQGGSQDRSMQVTVTVTNISASGITPVNIQAMDSGTKWQTEIDWQTDVAANSWVEYTPQADFITNKQTYTFTSTNHSDSAKHSIILYYLEPDTVYHYRIKSIDALNNIIVSDDHFFVTKK